MASGEEIALVLFFAIFVVIDIGLNTILCFAICRKKSLQTPMNCLILYLAISDIITGVFIIPRHIVSYGFEHPENTFSSAFLCKFITGGGILWISVTASSGILTMIAFERFFAILYPHSSRLRLTRKRLKLLHLICWFSAIAVNLPTVIVLNYSRQKKFCLEMWPSWVSAKSYVGVVFVAGTSSVVAMFVLYSIILYSLWKKNKKVSEVSRVARINARRRVTKMLIIISVIHAVFRIPNYIFYLLSYVDPDVVYGSTVYSFTVLLILINSASHPFMLCWYLKNIQKEVLTVLPDFVRSKIIIVLDREAAFSSSTDARHSREYSQSFRSRTISGLHELGGGRGETQDTSTTQEKKHLELAEISL